MLVLFLVTHNTNDTHTRHTHSDSQPTLHGLLEDLGFGAPFLSHYIVLLREGMGEERGGTGIGKHLQTSSCSFQPFTGRASRVSSSVGVSRQRKQEQEDTQNVPGLWVPHVPPITPGSLPRPSSVFCSESTFHLSSPLGLRL